jgi:hypothetical protein
VPDVLQLQKFQSEYDSKVAGHFRRDMMLELVTRKFYYPKTECNIRNIYCECDIWQWTKAPRHAKHELLHPLEL